MNLEILKIYADNRNFLHGQLLIALMELAKWQAELALNNQIVIDLRKDYRKE